MVKPNKKTTIGSIHIVNPVKMDPLVRSTTGTSSCLGFRALGFREEDPVSLKVEAVVSWGCGCSVQCFRILGCP